MLASAGIALHRRMIDMRLNVGMKVVVRFNPHHLDAKDVVGTVLAFRHGAGFGGANLAVVRYTHPRNVKAYTMPFALVCLAPAEARARPAAAGRHKAVAAHVHACVAASSR